MIKILSTGKNYPCITFYGTEIAVSTHVHEYRIKQEGNGDYVSNFEAGAFIPAGTPVNPGQLTFINETNYEMKIRKGKSTTIYTLAPGGRKTFSNDDADSVRYTVTYTSSNPPPQTVDVQAIIMG